VDFAHRLIDQVHRIRAITTGVRITQKVAGILKPVQHLLDIWLGHAIADGPVTELQTMTAMRAFLRVHS